MVRLWNYYHNNPDFTTFDIKLMLKLKSENSSWEFKISKYIDDLEIYNAGFADDLISGKINTKTIINLYINKLQNTISPSTLSHIMNYGYEHIINLIKFNDDDIIKQNLVKYAEDYTKMISYIDINYNLSTLNINSEIGEHNYYISIMNDIDPQLCGSFTECCLAESLNADYNWKPVHEKLEKMLRIDKSNFYSIKSMVMNNLLATRLQDIDDDEILNILSTEYSIDNWLSKSYFILWKAFLHFFMQDSKEYENKYVSIRKFAKILKDDKFNIKNYINNLRSPTILRQLYVTNKSNFKHNVSYNLEKISYNNINLEIKGECDLMNNNEIIDVKCYKNIENILRIWFYQIFLYSKHDNNINKLFIVELKHCNIYEFNNIKFGKIQVEFDKIIKKNNNEFSGLEELLDD